MTTETFLQMLEIHEGSPRITLNRENLDSVLSQVGERPLSILSLIGTPRQGKRFLLGYLTRYLEALENDEADWMDWDNPDKPLPGFPADNVNSKEVAGTWIYKRPFLINSEDKNVAVLILLTEANQQDFSQNPDFAAIVGLNLFISSCYVFNIFKQLPENFLSAIGTFTQFGLRAIQNTDGGKDAPFQKLLFLIRDWNYPTDFPYGAKGGKNFLQTKLEAKRNHSQEGKNARLMIRKCFQLVDCYLMPYPGQKAILPEFTGSISELDPQFAKKLDDLVSNLINSEDLSISTVNGKEITSADFKLFVENYLEQLQSDKRSPKSDLESEVSPSLSTAFSKKAASSSSSSTEPGNGRQVVKSALKKYTDIWKNHMKDEGFVSHKKLQKTHKLALKQALDALRKTSRDKQDNVDDSEDDDGTNKMLKQAEKKLKQEIKKKFEEFENENFERKETFVAECIKEAQEEYHSAMSKASEIKSLVDDNSLLKKSSQFITQAVEDFLEKLNEDEENDEEDGDLVDTLRAKLKQAENKYVILCRNQRATSEQAIGAARLEAIKEYTSKMEKIIHSSPHVDTGSLEVLHKEYHKSALKTLREELQKSGGSSKVEENLKVDLKQIYGEILSRHKATLEQQEAQAQELVSDLEALYSTALNSSVCETEADLQMFHSKQKNIIFEKYVERSPYPERTTLFSEHKANLTSKLQSIMSIAVKERVESKMKAKECITKAIHETNAFYLDELTKLFQTKFFMNDNLLEKANNTLLRSARDKYSQTLQHGNVLSGSAPSWENLEQKLAEKLAPLKTQNDTKRKIVFSQTKNLLDECIKEYQKAMEKQVGTARNAERLLELHKSTKDNAIATFKDKCQVKDDAEFAKPYLKSLEREIEDTFEEVQEIYNMKVNKEIGITKEALRDARKFYNEEMEKHFRHHEFIRPAQLQALHEEVSKKAIEKCFNLLPLLTPSQKLDLEEALEKTFVRYKEENDMNLQVEPAIGIDLGTTFSCVAVYAKGKVRIIPNSIGKNTTPSYVAFHADGSEVVGEPAKDRAYENPENTIFDAKRILGRKFNDENLQSDMMLWPFSVVDDIDGPKVNVRGKKLFPEQIAGKILRELKANAESYLKREVKKAVITIPAYFTDGQRQATIDAGELAGLKVLTVLTEPIAAAIAYKLQHCEEGERTVLIFDLGGGTFDVCLLKTSQGKIDALVVQGDTHLGGEDFDKNMMNFCAQEFKKQHNVDLFEGKDSPIKVTRDDVRRKLKRLQGECERKKVELTSARVAEVALDRMHGTTDLRVKVTRDQFNEINKSLFKKTTSVVEKALMAAKVDKSKVDDIVLVGGSTRIPQIQRMLEDYFGGKALDCSINPDEAVAYGAAIQAAIMNGDITKKSMDFTKIQDVTPMSYGVEVYGGGYSVIIPKSTRIPVKLQERYKTAHNNQTSVQITIYQGEEPIAVDNVHLGDFYFNGIPPNDAEAEDIDVEMVINSQGILHVNAVCTSTGQSRSTTISITENKQRMTKAVKRFLQAAD